MWITYKCNVSLLFLYFCPHSIIYFLNSHKEQMYLLTHSVCNFCHMKTSAVSQSLGSGMPTAVCCPCICCSARATCSSSQQSCRNTAARLRRRGLSEREKRSMHCRMAGWVISERDEGFERFISVVMADRTVSSLRLDRQFVTKLMPPLCRIMSLHSGSILRLHSPPERTWHTQGGDEEMPFTQCKNQ